MHLGIEQQVQGHCLVDVARLQAPRFAAHQCFDIQMQQADALLVNLDYAAQKACGVEEELVGVDVVLQGLPCNVMDCLAVALLRLDLVDHVPETVLEFNIALVQLVDVAEQLVAVVVLGLDAAGACLESHVDVLGHQHDAVARLLVLQIRDSVEDLVVVEVVGQDLQGIRGFAHQNGQAALRAELLASGNWHALFHFAGSRAGEHAVNFANRLAAIGGDGSTPHLERVELLQNGDGDDHVVFVEIADRRRIMNKDVGVQNVEDRSADLRENLSIACQPRLYHHETVLNVDRLNSRWKSLR